jgi:glycosyltransferase involved in cell wall biosynthesis
VPVMAARLSILVLTKNEEELIRNCLRTCTWADELIVVDSLSTDGTQEIARQFTDRVFSVDWRGYGEQRNRAMEFACAEWILFVDADERVSRPLRQEICTLLSGDPAHAGFKIPRYNYYLGKRLRFGTFYPDAQLRLFRKEGAHYAPDQYVHEVPGVLGSVGQLQNPLFHLSHRSISTVLQDLDNYTTLRASKRLASREKPVRMRTLIKGVLIYLWKLFIRQQAWRDGMEGVIENTLVMMEGFMTSAKVWEVQTKDYDAIYAELEEQIWHSIESGEPMP